MHRDTKVGLALGVLLVGVVGAFFFRHEGQSAVDVPALADPLAVDEAVAEKPIVPYLDEGATPAPANGGGDAPHWEPPRFLRADEAESPAEVSLDPLPPSDPSAAEPSSPAVEPVSHGTRFHVVQSGDTLMGIAAKYLGSTSKYLAVYEANRDVLASPDRLKLGQRLRIPDPNAPTTTRQARVEPVRVTRPSTTISREPAPEPTPSAEPSSSSTRETFDLPPVGENADEGTTPPARRFVPARRSPFVPTTSIRP